MIRSFALESFTKAELNFIQQNWTDKSDLQLSDMLGYSVQRIQKIRYSVGLKRRRKNYTSNKRIANVLEMFSNGNTIASISEAVGLAPSTVSTLIKRHYLTKKISEDTTVIVLQSKINN